MKTLRIGSSRFVVRDNRPGTGSVSDRLLRNTLTYEESGYLVVRGKFDTSSERYHPSVLGDHLYIQETNGPPLQVRLGDTSFPWIAVRAGQTLTRPFDRFWVRCSMDGNVSGLYVKTDYVFYVSFGPLVSPVANRLPGLRSGFMAKTSTITGATALGTLIGLSTSAYYTIGKNGGSLAIKNDDLAARLLVRWDSGASGQGFVLDAKETLTVDLADKLWIGASQASDGQIWLEPESGSCSVSILLNAEVDKTDIRGMPDSTLVGTL